MYKKNASQFTRLIASILIIAMVIPMGANAFSNNTSQQRASEYLSTYGAYIYPAGNGKVQVWFDVQGTGQMDELGTLSIQISLSKNPCFHLAKAGIFLENSI